MFFNLPFRFSNFFDLWVIKILRKAFDPLHTQYILFMPLVVVFDWSVLLWGDWSSRLTCKEALSVLMLCKPVYIYIRQLSSFPASEEPLSGKCCCVCRYYYYYYCSLGHPRCGLLICLLLLAISNTLLWVYATFFTRKQTKWPPTVTTEH